MQTQILLQKDVKAESETEHLEILTETCRILNRTKLCTRFCIACDIADNMATSFLSRI